MTIKTTTSETKLSGAWEGALSAFVDGRLDNLAFKHKQLYGLFELLQAEGTDGLDKRLFPELAATLRSLSTLLGSLPTDLTGEFDRRQRLQNLKDGAQKRATGVVAIVADDAHPFASWAVPLSQGIVDGNAAVILATPGVIIPDKLARRVDPIAFPVVWVDSPAKLLSSLPSGVTALVGPVDRLPVTVQVPTGHFDLRPVPVGPVPIIVDQSILPGGLPLSPQQQKARYVPRSVLAVARDIGRAFASRPTLGTPSYVLAHENLAAPLIQALESLGGLRPELVPLTDRAAAVKSLSQRKAPDALLVYSVRSCDMALDFVLDGSAPPAAYVFASHEFGAYVFNHLALPNVYINCVPADVLVLGPYANRSGLVVSTTARVEVGRADNSTPRLTSLDDIARIKARRLVQKPGKRIDFFGGSFLFAAGLGAIAILGGSGSGVVWLARKAYKVWLTAP